MILQFREAVEVDVPALVAMLADDDIGTQREDPSLPLHQAYVDAFAAIEADPNNELVVVVHEEQLVGMLQLTFIPYLTHMGTWRCQIEGVRIHRDFRGKGLGTQFFAWAIARAKERGCKLVQLTTDKRRPDAIRFYEQMGFAATHEGFKMKLS